MIRVISYSLHHYVHPRGMVTLMWCWHWESVYLLSCRWSTWWSRWWWSSPSSWNPWNVYGSVYGSRGHIRLDIWMAIVGVMGVCRAGQEPFAKRCHCLLELYQWPIPRTERPMRLYTTRMAILCRRQQPVLGKPLSVVETEQAALEAWNMQVPREDILAESCVYTYIHTYIYVYILHTTWTSV